MKPEKIFGSIEAGGTKFVCAVGTVASESPLPDAILESVTIPTETPEVTLAGVTDFLRRAGEKRGGLAALGVSSFGPIDVNKDSPTYGYITTTPKPGWKNTAILGTLRKALGVPVGFDTDVNGAALGEARWGAARGLSHVLYITVGTGIGGGVLVQGRPVHGLAHPEMGHIRVPHDFSRDPYPGSCPWHGDCLEGLANGPALAQRAGKPAQDISPNDLIWDIEADYLAAAAANFILTLSPEIIIMGGGVMNTPGLIEKVRRGVTRLLNGYIAAEPLISRMDSYIVPPGLGSLSGVAGGFVLAEEALGGL
ncbi:MAG: ROK family protein [Spirochaetales bacterium]|jgi:fructokinase|nr:ROK family protein [Spirochaetales bacterium]